MNGGDDAAARKQGTSMETSKVQGKRRLLSLLFSSLAFIFGFIIFVGKHEYDQPSFG
jgi:hypothetical protein